MYCIVPHKQALTRISTEIQLSINDTVIDSSFYFYLYIRIYSLYKYHYFKCIRFFIYKTGFFKEQLQVTLAYAWKLAILVNLLLGETYFQQRTSKDLDGCVDFLESISH